MDKHDRVIRIITFVMVVLSLVSVVGVLFPPTGEICSKNEYTGAKECASYNGVLVFFWHVYKALDSVSVALTGIATVFLAIITYLLVRLGQDQSRTARAQLRAYVFSEAGAIRDGATSQDVPTPVSTGCPNGLVWIKNFGNTPASNVRHVASLQIIARGSEDTLTIPDSELARCAPTSIGPHGMTSMEPRMVRAITPFEIQCLQTSAMVLVLFGRILYEDVFGREQETEYRLGYSGGYPPAPNVNLVFIGRNKHT